MRVNFFVDPACLWSWLTSRWLVQVAPQRDLDIQWRSYSLLLRDGTQGLQDQEVAIRTASHRAVRVMEALRRHDPAAVPHFYEALLPRTFAAVNAGGPPFAELDGASRPPGLPARTGRRPTMPPGTSRFASPWPRRSPPPVGWWEHRRSCCTRIRRLASSARSWPRHRLGLMRCGCGMRWSPWRVCLVCWSSRVPARRGLRSRGCACPKL